MTMWLPAVEDVLTLHRLMIVQTGGSDDVRSLPMIESAVARAEAAFAGVEAHPTLIDKAAAIGCGLVQNHGFVDGNKRTGIAALLLILRRNAVKLTYTQAELVALGLDVACDRMDVPQVAAWIREHAAG